MQNIRTLARVSVLIALYYLVYYIYIGILNPVPALGDSWDYHIPISVSILDGNFLTLSHKTIAHWHYPGTSLPLRKISAWYYPGSSEAINSLLILIHFPLIFSNTFAIVAWFFVLCNLGLT